jgi:hypothetical protein
MTVDKNFYNAASATKLGWDPSWFGCSYYDEGLVKAITKWQRKNGLTADGMLGPVSFRRIVAERNSTQTFPPSPPSPAKAPSMGRIVHNGREIPIEWGRTILWTDDNGMKVSSYNTVPRANERKPTMFVNHWDACLNSKDCVSVLEKRGISVHFCIDNDGTIYQLMDTQHIAWHAGDRRWNACSIGVEIANAHYTKYQPWYVRNGFGERPMLKGVLCHGVKMPDFLGFYPVQLEALKALWKACHVGMGIPLDCPTDSKGALIEGVDPRCENASFRGFVNHYNLTRRKTDCAGLDLVGLLGDLKKG